MILNIGRKNQVEFIKIADFWVHPWRLTLKAQEGEIACRWSTDHILRNQLIWNILLSNYCMSG